ncbi:hypothetical protein QF031_002158 [Pseudarthrobacter defluvii]|uniref:hypothetical protein n=1 Tax=Pseudarthrobacter defluvii TaxID=410837 RepID=UPI002782BCE2|nr:hypothetical protein [Pseudarthrobacter defluvii]MDQ0769409.1 hypothetical protein [Pseudarthrobacter defluvii]
MSSVTYLDEAKKSLARKDFEKFLADSAYPGLREHLGALQEWAHPGSISVR